MGALMTWTFPSKVYFKIRSTWRSIVSVPLIPSMLLGYCCKQFTTCIAIFDCKKNSQEIHYNSLFPLERVAILPVMESELHWLHSLKLLRYFLWFILGGYIANRMGIPLQIIPVTNENDIVARTLNSGDFSMSKEVKQSWACAIDIQCPYNLERLFYLAADRHVQAVQEVMDAFEKNQNTQVKSQILSELQKVIPGQCRQIK